MNEEEDLLKIKEFDENQLSKLISDLRDINSYTSFKNGSFIYDLGKYQGNLLINYIEQLQNNWNELKKWLEEKIDYLTKIDGQNIPLKDSFEFCSMNELYQTGKYSGFKESSEKMQELEQGKDDN